MKRSTEKSLTPLPSPDMTMTADNPAAIIGCAVAHASLCEALPHTPGYLNNDDIMGKDGRRKDQSAEGQHGLQSQNKFAPFAMLSTIGEGRRIFQIWGRQSQDVAKG